MILYRGYDKSAVKKIILLLATGFRDENASVARRVVQEATFVALAGLCWAQTGSFEHNIPSSRAS